LKMCFFLILLKNKDLKNILGTLGGALTRRKCDKPQKEVTYTHGIFLNSACTYFVPSGSNIKLMFQIFLFTINLNAKEVIYGMAS
jgi:hypothetical protein